MTFKKFKGIISNIAVAIGLFFPIFTIESLEKSLNTASSWGLNVYDLDGSISPLDIIPFFDGWINFFSDIDVSIGIITLPFLLFIAMEIIAAVFLIKSITILNYHIETSYNYSKLSIISLIVLYIIGIFTVLLYNGTISSKLDDSNIFTSYVAETLKMDFPVSALIFAIIGFVGIYWINSTASEGNNNKNLGWNCLKCNTFNSNQAIYCIGCGEKHVSSEETDNRKWYCSTCGKENSRLLSNCSSCGKPRNVVSAVTSTISQAAPEAINKVKDVISSVPKQFGNSSADFDKIKQLKELFDTGAINQEEFEAKKKEILKL